MSPRRALRYRPGRGVAANCVFFTLPQHLPSPPPRRGGHNDISAARAGGHSLWWLGGGGERALLTSPVRERQRETERVMDK